MINLSEENVEKIQLYVKQLILFLNNYTWILDAYVSDFYFKNHWDKLPESWRTELSYLTTKELSFFLDRQQVQLQKVLPLSLLSFKSCCDTYSLDRKCEDDISSKLQNLFSENVGRTKGIETDSDIQVKFSPLDESGKLHAFFKKHVKPKKQHEIKNLGQVIYLLSKHIKCANVVDVGSGLGHLARLMSFGYNLNVTSVEAAGTHAPKASKYDREIDREIKKKIQASEGKDGREISLPCHVTSMIYPNMTSEEFISIIKSHKQSDNDAESNKEQLNSRNCEVMIDTTIEPVCNKNDHSEPVCDSLQNISKPVCVGAEEYVVESHKRLSSDVQTFKDTKHAKLDSDVDIINNKYSNVVQNTEFLDKSDQVDSCGSTSEANFEAKELKSELTEYCYTSDTIASFDYIKEAAGSLSSDKAACDITCEETQPSKKVINDKVRDTSDNLYKSKLQKSVQPSDSAKWRFLLTGLHACGDLTPTFLRFFVNCDAAVGLASVGCCYMKISDESCGVETVGYPMSRFCSSLPHHQMSYASRELACHFADTYSQRLKECPPLLKIHSYRAALEWIANKLCPNFQRTAVQIPTKKIKDLKFDRYVKLGLEKLKIPLEQLSDDLLIQGDKMTERWKDVVAFYTIRLALAPVVETLVLLDRMMFLYEKGYICALLPVFDPGLSPRNFVLLSWKDIN